MYTFVWKSSLSFLQFALRIVYITRGSQDIRPLFYLDLMIPCFVHGRRHCPDSCHAPFFVLSIATALCGRPKTWQTRAKTPTAMTQASHWETQSWFNGRFVFTISLIKSEYSHGSKLHAMGDVIKLQLFLWLAMILRWKSRFTFRLVS